jgi:hypothetical protein
MVTAAQMRHHTAYLCAQSLDSLDNHSFLCHSRAVVVTWIEAVPVWHRQVMLYHASEAHLLWVGSCLNACKQQAWCYAWLRLLMAGRLSGFRRVVDMYSTSMQ